MVGLFGTEHQLSDQFSPSTGFDSIAVALLGRNTAIGVVLSGLLFGALEHGGALMQSSAGVSSRLVEVTQGLIIFFVAAEAIVRYLARRRVVRLPRWEREEAAA
jgi:simple sugar transport system permease protein